MEKLFLLFLHGLLRAGTAIAPLTLLEGVLWMIGQPPSAAERCSMSPRTPRSQLDEVQQTQDGGACDSGLRTQRQSLPLEEVVFRVGTRNCDCLLR